MKRYRMIAYYQDASTRANTAQSLVVIGEDVKSAVEAVKAHLWRRAQGGRIVAVEIKERDDVATGVVFTGEPYIPLHWPLLNLPGQPHGGGWTDVMPPEGGGEEN